MFLGVVPTLLAYRCWYFAGLAAVPAATAAVIVLLEPVTAAILAVVLLSEHLTDNIVAGSCLLLASLALLAWTKTATPKQPIQSCGR
jgi:DME family drug/metabolite transporter